MYASVAPSSSTMPFAKQAPECLELTECPQCGTFQCLHRGPGRTAFFCRTCTLQLSRTGLRSRQMALGCSIAALVLFLPANLLPFLTTSMLGASRQSFLVSNATAMYRNGYPELMVVMGLFLIVFPFLRFGLLTAVLGSLELGRRPPWLGRAFRWANTLEMWAMADVFLLGLAVAYARLKVAIAVDMGEGAMCYIAIGLLSLFIRAMLDKDAVWQAIRASPEVAHAPALIACPHCEMVMSASSEGTVCPRCAASVRHRRPNAVVRAIALSAAGVLLYIPANIYSMATLPVGYRATEYTILEGVVDLSHNGLFGLALLVFTASFAIPILELVGLGWCISSVLLKSRSHLRAKTWTYRVVEEVGRWSMVDPLVIATFVPVTGYNALLFGRAEPAAPAFTAVVILTILAARCFDPRLMWDAARTARQP